MNPTRIGATLVAATAMALTPAAAGAGAHKAKPHTILIKHGEGIENTHRLGA